MIIFEETTNYFNLQGNTSGIAENVFLTKYALTDEEGNILEKTPTQMFRRHAKALAEIEKNKGYKNISPYSEDELFEFFTEKFENYKGDERDYGGIILQGRPAFGIGNDHQFVSLLNCFILPPPEDSIGGISVREQEIIQIAKRGGGCGLVMDTIRPIGSSTKNSSRTTTGLIPFMEQYSLAVERIGQNGRRGALLMGLHMNHPEIKNFITCKNKKDSVTHANLPIFVSDDNMRDIEAGNPIKLEFNGQDYGEIDSKELWDLITSSMWNSGDPGLMFWSEHQRNSISDCYGDDWKIIGTNPCQPYDSVIALADGRNGEKIGKLFDEGKEILVYTAKEKMMGNKFGKYKLKNNRNYFNYNIEIKKANVIQRGIKNIIKLKLSNGNEIRCTPDHKIAINEEGIKYIEAKNSIGKRLIHMVTHSGIGKNKHRYLNSFNYNKQFRKIFEYYNGKIERGYCIHHIDFDGYNDSVDNMISMKIRDHTSLHQNRKNSINKIPKDYLLLSLREKNIMANTKKYNKGDAWMNEELKKHKERNKHLYFEYEQWKKNKKQNEENQYSELKKLFEEKITVVSIEECGQEMTYDLQVEDNHNYFNLVSYDDNYINSQGILMHNCGEIHGAPYQSCLLLSLNLYRFVENPFTASAKFNFDKFKKYVFASVRIGDDIVDLEEQKINSILRKIENDPESEEVKSVEYNLWKKILEKLLLSRKIGVGFTALADCLAALNLKYDSDEGIEMILKIGKALRDNSYQASVDLAEDVGTFPIFDFEKEESGNCEFLTRLYNDCPELKEQTRKYGRRNMTLNTCAPTGTISLCAGVSAGIEPVFSLIETRMKKASFVDESKKDSYHTDSEGILWEKYQIKHPKLKKWELMNPGKTEHPYVEAYDVDYKKRAELQGCINKYIDNSISSTVNLPEDITPEEISEVLFAAWKSGCKGITVFRENSRMAVKSRTDNDSNDEVWPNGVYKRPKSIPAECMHMTYNKEPYVLIVGLVKGNPYETWIWKIEDKLIFPYGAKNFHIVKERKGKYILTWDKRTDEDPGKLSISDLQVDNSLIFAFTRLISAFLRHNPNELEVLISTFEKMPQFDSIPKLIARLLKKYLKDGTRIYGLQCPTCEHALTRKSGCVFCENCGYSVCS